MDTKTCNTCKDPITDKKLQKYGRACLNTNKEERGTYKMDRENTTMCPCCKLYKDLEGFMPKHKLIYCQRCREIKNKSKGSKQGSSTSTTASSDGEACSSNQPMQEQQPKQLVKHVKINLKMCAYFLKSKYKMDEDEEGIFNIWNNWLDLQRSRNT